MNRLKDEGNHAGSRRPKHNESRPFDNNHRRALNGLVETGDFFQVSRKYVRYGLLTLEESVILQELRNVAAMRCDDDSLWFVYTVADMEGNTGYKRDAQIRILNVLRDKGYIDYEKSGNPAKRHICVIEENIANDFNEAKMKGPPVNGESRRPSQRENPPRSVNGKSRQLPTGNPVDSIDKRIELTNTPSPRLAPLDGGSEGACSDEHQNNGATSTPVAPPSGSLRSPSGQGGSFVARSTSAPLPEQKNKPTPSSPRCQGCAERTTKEEGHAAPSGGPAPLPQTRKGFGLRPQAKAEDAGDRLARVLYKGLSLHNVATPRRERWPRQFRDHLARSGLETKRVENLLSWYCDDLRREYLPQAYCPRTFFEKFAQIEEYARRRGGLEPPQPEEKKIIVTVKPYEGEEWRDEGE